VIFEKGVIMKHLIHLFAVIAVIALLTACSSKGAKTETPAPTGAKDVYIDVTDAPTEPETFADVTDASTSSNDASLETAPTGAPAAAELTDHQWNLSAVYRDGEQQNIGVIYGSVIRETGAYLKFNEDDTFECVLGVTGCKGTYAVENGDIALHITTKFSAKTEECDEHGTVKWDHNADTLTFDFNNITNVFTKGS
jgi:hypothetical protein